MEALNAGALRIKRKRCGCTKGGRDHRKADGGGAVCQGLDADRSAAVVAGLRAFGGEYDRAAGEPRQGEGPVGIGGGGLARDGFADDGTGDTDGDVISRDDLALDRGIVAAGVRSPVRCDAIAAPAAGEQ